MVATTAQHLKAVCLTALLLLAGRVDAQAARLQIPDEQPERSPATVTGTLPPPTLSPRVFTRGQNVRFHYLGETNHWVFQAKWKSLRVPTRDFKVKVAVLNPVRSHPPPPPPASGWREAMVLSRQQWQELAAALIEDLTPATPGEAVHLQSVLGDAVLFRAPDGTVQKISADRKPPQVSIQQRYSWDDALAVVASGLERHLRHRYAGHDLFLLFPPGDQASLLDLDRRLCVILDHPWHNTGETLALTLPYAARGMVTLLVEGHGRAFLKNPFSSVIRLGNLTVQSVLNLASPGLRRPRSPIPALDPKPGMDLPAWEAWLDRYTGTRREPGELQLLIGGESFYSRFEQALREARRSIHLIVCIFDRDDVAVRLADLLKERSAEVEVRVILDQMSSLAAGASASMTPLPDGFRPPPSIRAYLKNDSSVQVRSFLNPWLSADHSKLLIVDGERAWVGGMNFGREYRYEWHDLMLEIEGPILNSLQRLFWRSWDHAGSMGDLAYVTRAWADTVSASHSPLTGEAISIRRLPTRTAWKPLAQAIAKSIDQARNYVYLQNPYLFDNRVVARLARARGRGVDVRVILPSRSDLLGGERSNLVTANYLLQHGVRVFFYPGMTHVKALLVDDWACLGSANFNHLSLRLNQELNLATSDPGFTRSLREDLFERDFERAVELTEELSLGWADQLFERVLNAL